MTDTIRVLTDIEKIHESPAMYIGDNSDIGLHTIIREVIDNAVDEYPNYTDKTKPIIINIRNGIVSVRDFGRGISPYESKANPGEIEERLAFSRIGAGGKFKKDRLKNGNLISGGMHGVGATATNAMSSYFNVTIYKDGYIFEDKYIDAVPQIEYVKKGKKLQLPSLGKTNETGTFIEFKPSNERLLTTKIDIDKIKKIIKDLSYLNPGLKIIFNDQTYVSEEGISGYLYNLTNNDNIITLKNVYEENDIFMMYNIAFNINNEGNQHKCFTNNIFNSLGGTHESGFKNGLSKLLKEYYNEFTQELKSYKKKIDFILKSYEEDSKINKLEDLIESKHISKYTSYIIDFKYNKPSLAPQTKDKLVSKEIINLLSTQIQNHSIDLLKEHKKELTQLYKYIIDDLYENAKENNETVKINSSDLKSLTRKKLASARSTDPKELELIIVEGDSAAGSLKINRNADYQAILPLKGKILNVQKASLKKAFVDTEIATMFAILFGDNATTKRDSTTLLYHKIIVATDQDVDGLHIRSLLTTLFNKFAPDIIENGHVFYLDTPLFVNKTKNGEVYTYSNEEQTEFLKTTKPINIERKKGLGELSHPQVRKTILDKDTRKLTQLYIEDTDEFSETVDLLMGKDTTYRKNYIMNN